VDLYAGDKPDLKIDDWHRLADDSRFIGGVIKATEGLYYDGGTWFVRNWLNAGVAGRMIFRPWVRGCYHYLKFNYDGAKQADFYARVVSKAGGFLPGDLPPIVDVERGGDGNSNLTASKQQVVDCVSSFSKRITEVVGVAPILYGNGAMRDLKITDRMGCSHLWLPRYTPTLPREIYERAGWDLAQLFAWQYCGDGEGYLKGYPTETPIGKVDISVLTLPGGVDALKNILLSR
jgi:GH25 family lysozyme M1 (1,4-beta-N-acetylmuramidase)